MGLDERLCKYRPCMGVILTYTTEMEADIFLPEAKKLPRTRQMSVMIEIAGE